MNAYSHLSSDDDSTWEAVRDLRVGRDMALAAGLAGQGGSEDAAAVLVNGATSFTDTVMQTGSARASQVSTQDQRAAKCRHCGNVFKNDSVYCRKCGEGRDMVQEELTKLTTKEQNQLQALNRKMETLKASTMSGIVYTAHDLTRGGTKKICFLTNLQAEVMSNDHRKIEDFIEALGIPRPQLLIYLLPSWGGVTSVDMYKEVGLQNLLDTPLAGLGRGVSFPTREEAFDSEEKLALFMRKVLIPLAADNHALVLVGGLEGVCVLSKTFNRMLDLEKHRWGNNVPFTIMSFCNFLAPLYNDLGEDRDWHWLMRNSKAWMEGDARLRRAWGEYTKVHREAQWRGDLDPRPNVFLIVDGVSENNGIDFGPMQKFVTQLVSYQQTKIPIIGIKSYQAMKGEYALGGLKTALDVMTTGCPLLFLDVHAPEQIRGMMLQVTIIEAKNLRQSNLKPGAYCDPYCVCRIENKGTTRFVTKVETDTANPKWGQRFLFTDYEDGDRLIFQIFDCDPEKVDEEMGHCSVESRAFHANAFDEWVPLTYVNQLLKPKWRCCGRGKELLEEPTLRVKIDVFNWLDGDTDGRPSSRPVSRFSNRSGVSRTSSRSGKSTAGGPAAPHIVNRSQLIDEALAEYMRRCDALMQEAKKTFEIDVTRIEGRTETEDERWDDEFCEQIMQEADGKTTDEQHQEIVSRLTRSTTESVDEKRVECETGLTLSQLEDALRIRFIDEEFFDEASNGGSVHVTPGDRIVAVNRKRGSARQLLQWILESKKATLTLQHQVRRPYFLDVCAIAHFYHIFYGDKETFERASGNGGSSITSAKTKWAVKLAKQSKIVCPLYRAIDRKRKDTGAGQVADDENWAYPAWEIVERVMRAIITRFFQDCWELREAREDAEQSGNCGKNGHANCRTARQHYQDEIQDWRQYAETFLRPPDQHMQNFHTLTVADHADIEGGIKLVECLTKRDRLPQENSLEGLCTLREAWKEVDECTFYSNKYKLIAKALFSIYLYLQCLIVFCTVFRGYYVSVESGTRRLTNILEPLEPEVCGYLAIKLARTCPVAAEKVGLLDSLMGHSGPAHVGGVNQSRTSAGWSAMRRLANATTLSDVADLSLSEELAALFAYDACAVVGCDTDSFLRHVIFTLSLLSASALSINIFFNPVQRWRQVRSSASSLESIVWRYRSRVGEFAVQKGNLCAPDKALADALTTWRKDLVAGSDLLATALNRRYTADVYTHYQYRGEVPQGDPPVSGRKGRSEEEENFRNDHQSPVEPEAYVQMRLIGMMTWYQIRLPYNAKRRTVFTIFTLTCTICSSLACFYDEDISVALLISLAATTVAWSEFVDVGRKIERYSGCIRDLKATLSWWDSLNEVGKASTENITRLVLDAETTITNEHLAWKSTSSGDKDKKQDGATSQDADDSH